MTNNGAGNNPIATFTRRAAHGSGNPSLSRFPLILPPSPQLSMSRPGPKPNNDPISERVDCLERLFRHILRDNTDDTIKELLRELDELKNRPFLCPICNKSYSDAKGLRRHILTASVDHAALAIQLSALLCRYCGRSTTDVGRKYTKMEQVTKHEHTCGE